MTIAPGFSLDQPHQINHLAPDEVLANDSIFNFFVVIPEILATPGGDNRLTAVVIGGISLAVAAALCTIVTEPAAAPNSSHRHGSVGKPAESSV